MLMIGIYDKHPSLGGRMILDASPWATSCTITTDAHGFAACSLSLRQALANAMQLYDVSGALHIGVYDGAGVIWEGRLEDPGLFSGDGGSGNDLAAYGYSRAMSDVPYTSLWSCDSVEAWRVSPDAISIAGTLGVSGRMASDTNNRLYMAPNKGAVWPQYSKAGLYFDIPNISPRNVLYVSFNYTVLFPSATWNVYLRGLSLDWAGMSGNFWFQPGSGSGTFSGAIGNSFPRLFFFIEPNAATTYGGETGDYYVRITNLRITTSGATIYADEIVRNLVSFMSGVNPGQLSSSTALIQSPGLDLRNESYEDMPPSDILNTMISRGDSQTPPRYWEWGVWEDQRLYFRPRGAAGMTWYVDATDLSVTRSLTNVANNVYALYKDANGDAVRGTSTSDSASQARYGLIRQAKIDADTTSATEANAQRSAYLNDHKDPLPSAKISFSAIYDAYGGRWPLWRVRSGDQIVIRNLPPGSGQLDRVRQFRISTTSYDAVANTLSVEPEAPPATLETMLAREAIGYE